MNIGAEACSLTLLVKYTHIFIIVNKDILSLSMSQHTPLYKCRMELKQRLLFVNKDKSTSRCRIEETLRHISQHMRLESKLLVLINLFLTRIEF